MSSEGEPARTGAGSLLVDIARAAVCRDERPGWAVEPGEFWCRVTPPGWQSQPQGWKLHVSATALAAPVVLARVAAVLVAEGCGFKFARGLAELSELLSNRCPRGAGGKFVTAYPAGDDQFRRLAAELDRVTDGLPGPPVLSDRPVRAGSLVHYRYGVFGAEPVLGNDGSFRSVLTGPDGEQVVDERQAWFAPPPWAQSPLAAPEPPAGTSQPATGTPTAVLLGERFEVRGGVRHSYRGGVFRATDRQTGAEVIVKQARPHVMADLTGRDARDLLRHEAEVLAQLGPLGVAPELVAVVGQQDNLFLAQELVPGVTLRQWAAERSVAAWQGRGAPPAEAAELAGQLVELVAAVHGQGLVLRDLSPNNVMVTPDGRLRLIDVEHAVPVGTRVAPVSTPGYGAPELAAMPAYGPEPGQRADLFSLGATVLHLASAVDPLRPPDEPAGQPPCRMSALVTALAAHMPAVRMLLPLLGGLTHDDPEQRWDLDRARTFLTSGGPAPDVPDGPAWDGLPAGALDRLIDGGLRHLLATMRPADRWLWRPEQASRQTDPCNVHFGAAGVLGVLSRVVALDVGLTCAGTAQAGQYAAVEGLRDGVATAAAWLGERLSGGRPLLPGLHFGRAGAVWALHDAARLLDDEELAARAVGLARQLPLSWPNPDVCHGSAGAGLALLQLWASTGDPEVLHAATEVADGLLAAAVERDGLLVWPIPADFDSSLAGQTYYGFAHGVAGVGAFLLYAGVAAGQPEYVEVAERAGETLVAIADVETAGTGGAAAWWRGGPDPDAAGMGTERLRHWCHGSSGVGTFLIRLWAATGRPRYRELAEAAATATHRDRWYSPPVACHGLAGDGEFLLDVADLTGEPRHREQATDLAAVLHTRYVLRDGLAVPPGGSWLELAPNFGTGMAGTLGFLLRLRHGGPRFWLPDQLLPTPAPRR